jgi:hypothetical protein
MKKTSLNDAISSFDKIFRRKQITGLNTLNSFDANEKWHVGEEEKIFARMLLGNEI